MAQFENYRTIRPDNYKASMWSTAQPATPRHPLDTPEAKERLRTLEDWWYQARQAQAENRYEQALDQDFYDGLQWRDDEKLALLDRMQSPLVFNRIKPSVDWILGTEKRTRVESKVHPRGEEDLPLAEVKTKLLKYIGDVNKLGFARSRAFADAVIVGIGWLEDAIRKDSTEEILFSRTETWRNMWYDHLSVERDLSDARYLFRSKWVDLDVAVTMFPESGQSIRAASQAHDLWGSDDDEFYWLTNRLDQSGRQYTQQSYFDDAFNANNRRQRVRLIEAWYRVPTAVQIMRGTPQIEGLVYNPRDPFHSALVDQEYASLFDATRMLVRCAMFIGGSLTGDGTLLQDIPSPYRHNRFPFTPIWCYRRGRDNAPYGVVRNLRDPQEDLNKRRSKALFILSTNRLVANKNAFDDWDEVAEEVAKPNMILKKTPGTEVIFDRETALVEEHVMMERDDAQYIQDVSGVTDENMGRQTNAVSGTAIQARQNQGTLVTAEMFDNLRYAIQLQGEKQLSLVEQFYDQAKKIRIIGGRGHVEFITINQPLLDEYGRPVIENDITASQADFIVDTMDFRESVRMAMFEQLMNLCGQLPPEITIQVLDLVVELSDIPDKDEIVKRIRKINGQMDPDAADDPEAQAELRARQIEEQRQADMQDQAVQLTLAEQEAKVRKLLADVQLVLEKVKTEEVNREATARQAIMGEEKFKADEKDRRFQRNLQTYSAISEREMQKAEQAKNRKASKPSK